MGHPACPLEVLAEGTHILSVGAHRQVLFKLVVFVVCPGLASNFLFLMLFAVVDFVSSDLEDIAQKCSLSYKVKGDFEVLVR